MEGIYYFGGKNQNLELNNKIKYLKPICTDGEVSGGEW
jgi:hypothetical protein